MKIVLFGTLLALAATTAGAQQTFQQYGNTVYQNGANGRSSTYQTYGNQTYRNDSSGTSGTYQTYGNQTYRNDSNGYNLDHP